MAYMVVLLAEDFIIWKPLAKHKYIYFSAIIIPLPYEIIFFSF